MGLVSVQHAVLKGPAVPRRDGNLWVALADGGAVACYCADTGRQLQKARGRRHPPHACPPTMCPARYRTRRRKGVPLVQALGAWTASPRMLAPGCCCVAAPHVQKL